LNIVRARQHQQIPLHRPERHIARNQQYLPRDPQQLPHLQRHRQAPQILIKPGFADCHLRRWLKNGNGVNVISVQKSSQRITSVMKGVFLMELEDDDDATAVADDLGISLHALIGITGANTMQLLVNIAGQELHALVDSGSTHTFIHDVIVHRLGLKVTLQPGLSVKVANGERLQSYNACKATNVIVQDENIVMNCYALPLEGFNIILGIQWLKSLGPIMWDFATLKMAFVREGRSVRLVGCGGTPSALYSLQPADNIMDTLL
jgi:hypothetical protein